MIVNCPHRHGLLKIAPNMLGIMLMSLILSKQMVTKYKTELNDIHLMLQCLRKQTCRHTCSEYLLQTHVNICASVSILRETASCSLCNASFLRSVTMPPVLSCPPVLLFPPLRPHPRLSADLSRAGFVSFVCGRVVCSTATKQNGRAT